MAVQPYINFNGNCREAVEFYAEAFKTGKPQFMQFKDAPPNPEFPLSEEAKNLIMHATIVIGGTLFMFSDVFPGMPYIAGNNISLLISSFDADEIKSMFDKLKVGGTVETELQETFWSKCYGSVTDKFGIGWQFSLEKCEIEK